MVTLQLAVDSTGAVTGTQAISREFERLGQQATSSAQRVDQLETNLGQMAKEFEASRKAAQAFENENRRLQDSLRNTQAALQGNADKAAQFQRAAGALNEVTQVGQRVKLLGEEVRNLGSGFSSASSVLNTFALGLTDVAQISSRAQGGFGGLVALLRANPLLAAAGVLTAIATAMGLFGDKTAETNDKLKQQADLLEQIRQSQQTFRERARLESANLLIGIESKPGERERTIALALRDEALRLGNAGGNIPLSELQRVLGEVGLPSRRDFVSEFSEMGFPRSMMTFQPGYGQTGRAGAERQPLDVSGRLVEEYLLNVARQQLEAAKKLEASSQNLDTAVRAGGAGVAAPGADQAPGFTGILNARQIAALQRQAQRPIGPQPGPDYMTPEQMAAYTKQFAPPTVLADPEALQRGQEELERFNERLREMKSLGQEAGTAIGNAFFSIVNGAGTARQALAALLQQFVAIAQQRAVAGFANAVSNSFGKAVGNAPGVSDGDTVSDPRN